MIPLISFIVPIYNVDKYLTECIESIINQKEEKLEIILINDGSTDNSKKICDLYKNKDKRIHVIHQKNQGVSVARNTGLNVARGKWVCFVDADDKISKNFIDELYPYLYSECDICFFSYREFGDRKKNHKLDNSLLTENYDKGILEELEKAIYTMNSYRHVNAASIWGKLYKKEFLEKYNINFLVGQVNSQDTLFAIKTLEHAVSGLYINKELYYYRIIKNSVSRRYNPKIMDIYSSFLNELYQFTVEKNNNQFMKLYYYRVFRNFIVGTTLSTCHPENHSSYQKRKEEFLYLRNQEPYSTAIQKTNIKDFPVLEAILAFLIKNRLFFIMSCLNKLRYKYFS